MNINLAKTITELAPLQISDFVDVDFDTIKTVAAASNGQFLIDRNTLSAAEFLTKYFGEYEVYDTFEKQEARRMAQRTTDAKAKAKAKLKANRDALLNDYGDYIVALWECGNEFSASYRKTDHIEAHWRLLSKNEIEYKTDGRRFSVVCHVQSRNEALDQKTKLIEDYISRGWSYKGELPV